MNRAKNNNNKTGDDDIVCQTSFGETVTPVSRAPVQRATSAMAAPIPQPMSRQSCPAPRPSIRPIRRCRPRLASALLCLDEMNR